MARYILAQPPPALLHVSRESQYLTMRKYKPWLLQFKETPTYQPWAHFIKNTTYDPTIRLQNVYIDIEKDILLMRWLYFPRIQAIEYLHTHQIALDVTGSGYRNRVGRELSLTRPMKALQEIFFFRDSGSQALGRSMGVGFLEHQLGETELRNREASWRYTPNYVAPSIRCIGLPNLSNLARN